MMTHLYVHRDLFIYAMIISMYFEHMCAMIHQRRMVLTLACWQGRQGLGPGVWSWDSSLFLSLGGCYASPLMRSLRCQDKTTHVSPKTVPDQDITHHVDPNKSF